MENSLVSIIVPVYNVEKYIRRCINSILSQSYRHFELLLIDDGSKDSSGKICDEYEKIDDRVIVFHQKNQGVSSARNVGIQHSTGEYIVFIDSDDEIEKYFIEDLLQYKQFDIVLSGFKIINLDSRTIVNNFLGNLVYNEEALSSSFSTFLKKKIMLVPWAKLYKTDIIKSNEIFFEEKYKLGEDTLFNFRYFAFIKSLAVINKSDYIFYNYNHSILIDMENALSLVNDLQKEWKTLVLKYPLLSKDTLLSTKNGQG